MQSLNSHKHPCVGFLKYLNFNGLVTKECKFATARKDTLTKHKKIHINREYIPKVSINRKYTPKPNYNYICEKCNESFDIQAKFVNHILKHPGYKPFKCNYKNS